MAEEIAFDNRRISKFKELLTLTLDRVILYTIVHHSSTSAYMPNSIEIEDKLCGRTDVRTDVGRTDGRTFEIGFIRSTAMSSLRNVSRCSGSYHFSKSR